MHQISAWTVEKIKRFVAYVNREVLRERVIQGSGWRCLGGVYDLICSPRCLLRVVTCVGLLLVVSSGLHLNSGSCYCLRC